MRTGFGGYSHLRFTTRASLLSLLLRTGLSGGFQGLGRPVDETSSSQRVWSRLAGKWAQSWTPSLFTSPGVWVIHPSPEVPAVVGGDGEGADMIAPQGILETGERAA